MNDKPIYRPDTTDYKTKLNQVISSLELLKDSEDLNIKNVACELLDIIYK